MDNCAPFTINLLTLYFNSSTGALGCISYTIIAEPEGEASNRDALLFPVCMYVCMYICISVPVNPRHLDCTGELSMALKEQGKGEHR